VGRIENKIDKYLKEVEDYNFFFVVIRESEGNSDRRIFNDIIQLRDYNRDILYKQWCDSIADKSITSRWSKRTEDSYTIKEGIFPLQKSRYVNRKTGFVELAYIIQDGYTRAGFRIGLDFTLNHMIHRSSYYTENRGPWIRGMKRGASGGCMVLPKDNNDIFTYMTNNSIDYKTKHLIIINDFR
jgi:hypothetical protein